MHKHIEEQASGANIRSRAKWVEEGEKSSMYFHNLERKNYSNNTIKQLKRKMVHTLQVIKKFEMNSINFIISYMKKTQYLKKVLKIT